jgi:hypothetical protein
MVYGRFGEIKEIICSVNQVDSLISSLHNLKKPSLHFLHQILYICNFKVRRPHLFHQYYKIENSVQNISCINILLSWLTTPHLSLSSFSFLGMLLVMALSCDILLSQWNQLLLCIYLSFNTSCLLSYFLAPTWIPRFSKSACSLWKKLIRHLKVCYCTVLAFKKISIPL